MSGVLWESDEVRNYMCFAYIVADLVPVGLRKVFKQEWNSRYQANYGPWNDTEANGQIMSQMERNNLRISEYRHGDTNVWDSTMLFMAILYSNSIGKLLNPTTRREVDNLRKLRNKLMHSPKGKLSDAEFQTMVSDVENAFGALGLPVNDVTQIRVERNLTYEVVHHPEKMKEIRQELQKLCNDRKGKRLHVVGTTLSVY